MRIKLYNRFTPPKEYSTWFSIYYEIYEYIFFKFFFFFVFLNQIFVCPWNIVIHLTKNCYITAEHKVVTKIITPREYMKWVDLFERANLKLDVKEMCVTLNTLQNAYHRVIFYVIVLQATERKFVLHLQIHEYKMCVTQ